LRGHHAKKGEVQEKGERPPGNRGRVVGLGGGKTRRTAQKKEKVLVREFKESKRAHGTSAIFKGCTPETYLKSTVLKVSAGIGDRVFDYLRNGAPGTRKKTSGAEICGWTRLKNEGLLHLPSETYKGGGTSGEGRGKLTCKRGTRRTPEPRKALK